MRIWLAVLLRSHMINCAFLLKRSAEVPINIYVSSDFFNALPITPGDTAIFVVSHILPDKLEFLDAIAKIGPIAGIIPKKKSVDRNTLAPIKTKYPVLTITKEDLASPQPLKAIRQLKRALGQPSRPFIILDIGGYFANITQHFASANMQCVGIVEDTENGHQKYENAGAHALVYSVARSPLKETEDFLVGHSIVFSAEAVLRQNQELLTGMDVGIIGFGKIGRSIISNLSHRNIRTTLYDIDPIKRVQAKSFGYHVGDKQTLLSSSDYIFCATGKKALADSDYDALKGNACIFSVTSSDDEFDLAWLKQNYQEDNVTKYITRYLRGERAIRLANNGNAINFLHGAVVGDYIRLVQAEMLLCVDEIRSVGYSGTSLGGIRTLGQHKRQNIAEIWEGHFARHHDATSTDLQQR